MLQPCASSGSFVCPSAASLCTQPVHLCSQALLAELGQVKQAVRVPLVEVLALVREVHEGVSTVNQELALCPVADLEDDLASEAASRTTEEDEAELMSRRFRRAPAWPKGPRSQLGARPATHRSASPSGLPLRPERSAVAAQGPKRLRHCSGA